MKKFVLLLLILALTGCQVNVRNGAVNTSLIEPAFGAAGDIVVYGRCNGSTDIKAPTGQLRKFCNTKYTPGSDGTYLVVNRYTLKPASSTTVDEDASLKYNTGGADTTIQNIIDYPNTTAASDHAMVIEQLALTGGSTYEFKNDLEGNGTSNNWGMKEADILLWKPTFSLYTESEAASSTTQTTMQTKTAGTTSSAGLKLILWSAEIKSDSSVGTTNAELNYVIGGNASSTTNFVTHTENNNAEYMSIGGIYATTTDSTATDWQVRFDRTGVSGTAYIQNARIAVLDMSGDTMYSNFAKNATTTAETTYRSSTSVTQTLAAGYYLVLGSAILGNSTGGSNSRAVLDIDGTDYQEADADGDSNTDERSLFFMKLIEVTAEASHSAAIQYRAVGGTASIQDSRVAIIDVTDEVTQIENVYSNQVAATADDGIANQTDASFDSNNLTDDIGFNSSSKHIDGYARFLSVNIDQGADQGVQEAFFQAHSAGASGGTPNQEVYLFDEDDSAAVTSWADYNGRATTTAFVAWSRAGEGTLGNLMTPGDLSTVVEEVVDRSGWTSGNDLQVVLFNKASAFNNYQRFEQQETTSYASFLFIRWKETLTSYGATASEEHIGQPVIWFDSD